MGMAEVMLGEELHPDRVIQIEKLYEIMNECGIPYSFPARHGIESNAFAVVRCKDCKQWCNSWVAPDGKHEHGYCRMEEADDVIVGRWGDDFCSYGERRTE